MYCKNSTSLELVIDNPKPSPPPPPQTTTTTTTTTTKTTTLTTMLCADRDARGENLLNR